MLGVVSSQHGWSLFVASSCVEKQALTCAESVIADINAGTEKRIRIRIADKQHNKMKQRNAHRQAIPSTENTHTDAIGHDHQRAQKTHNGHSTYKEQSTTVILNLV